MIIIVFFFFFNKFCIQNNVSYLCLLKLIERYWRNQMEISKKILLHVSRFLKFDTYNKEKKK